MFRMMRRSKQEVSEVEVTSVLVEEKRAAFSVIGENAYPYTIPINFYYDEVDHQIYFHSAKAGHKVDAIKKNDKVCLTVWNQGFKKGGRWEWNVTSVVVFGKVKFIDDLSVVEEKLRKLATKYYPSQEEVEIEMNGPAFQHVQLFAIEIDHITGKLVNEK